jgi:hypothetical protein
VFTAAVVLVWAWLSGVSVKLYAGVGSTPMSTSTTTP